MSEEKKGPCGVIAIVTNPHGDVIATAADFERSGYGGFKLWEAQKIRARDAVRRETIRRYSSPTLSDALDGYAIDVVCERLFARAPTSHKITYRAVGYDGDTADAIER
jgi:hypothetical protein